MEETNVINSPETIELYKSLNRKYGYTTDDPDLRDYPFSLKMELKDLPKNVDLRNVWPKVYNQKSLSSCVANAVSGAMEFDEIKQTGKPFTPSRLFIYYNTRILEKTQNEDVGSGTRNALKTVLKEGACKESYWPYKIENVNVKPNEKSYKKALTEQVLRYERLTTLNDFKICLANNYPIITGINIFKSFESRKVNKTGIVPMPSTKDKNIGGHCMLIVGYDEDKKLFIFRNSWGPRWGIKGHCYIPYEYVEKYINDYSWVIYSVE